jgi:hypothetical protein
MPSTKPSGSRSWVVLLLLAAATLAACGGAASTAPGSTIRPSVAPVTTREEALARVIDAEPRFRGVKPFDTGLVGQSSWYTVEPASGVGAFIVTMRIGWGDCESGCIDEHQWVFAVGPNGNVSVLSEKGRPVPVDAWPSLPADGRTGIVGSAVAGPVCPVERVPPDPACAPRPVEGAVIVVRAQDGSEVARATTLEDGSFFVELSAGTYQLEPQAVDGLMGRAAAQTVTVADGSATTIQLDYDTGIR